MARSSGELRHQSVVLGWKKAPKGGAAMRLLKVADHGPGITC